MYSNELLKPVLESGIVTPEVEKHVADFLKNTAQLDIPPSVGILIRNARLYHPVPRFMHVYTFFSPHNPANQAVEDSLLAEQVDLFVRMHQVGDSKVFFHDITGAAFRGVDHEPSPFDFRRKLDKMVSQSNLKMLAFKTPEDPHLAWMMY